MSGWKGQCFPEELMAPWHVGTGRGGNSCLSSFGIFWRSALFKIELLWFISPKKLPGSPCLFWGEKQSKDCSTQCPAAAWGQCSCHLLGKGPLVSLVGSGFAEPHYSSVAPEAAAVHLSERRILGRLTSIFSSTTSLRSSLQSFHFAVCQQPHFTVKKHSSVPSPAQEQL